MGLKSAIIVDDSKLARVTLRKKLGKHGVNADLAESAEQAFEMLKSNRYDVVFMDHLMPGVDGFEATQRIRKTPQGRTLPIIMCTGKEHEGYLQEAQAIGADYTLTKPPTEDALSMILSMEFEPSQGSGDQGMSLAEIDAELDELEALADETLELCLPEMDETVEPTIEPEAIPAAESAPMPAVNADAVQQMLRADLTQQLAVVRAEMADEINKVQSVSTASPAPDTAEVEAVVSRLLKQAAPQMVQKVTDIVEVQINQKIHAAMEKMQPQMSAEDISTLVKSRVNVQLEQKTQHLDKMVADLKEQQQLGQAAMEGLINEAIETGSDAQLIQEVELLAVEQEAMARSIATPKTLAGIALVIAFAAVALAAMPFVTG